MGHHPGRDDLTVAREALDQGDPVHAAFHAAGALAEDPSGPAAEVLDRAIAAVPDPDRLVPLGQQPYFGEVLGRAYVFAKTGQSPRAVSLISQLLTAFPDRAFERFATDWVLTSKVALDPLSVGRFFAEIVGTTTGRIRLRATERAFYARFVPLALAMAERTEGSGSPIYLTVASGLVRRAGKSDDATRFAERALAQEEKETHYAALALSRRAAGDCAGADAAFRRAGELSADPLYLVERTRVAWQDGRLADALELLRRFQREKPDDRDPEVAAMLMYLETVVEGIGDSGSVVATLGPEAHPDDFVLFHRPWVGWLPSSSDASVNGLRSVAKEHSLRGLGLKLAVSCIEAPSVRLALPLATRGDGDLTQLPYSFDRIAEPDPRQVVGDPRWRVWQYQGDDGKVPVQVPPPPSAGVSAAVRELAADEYYLPRWWSRAGEIGPRLGAHAIGELLGAMVHPNEPPPSVPAWDWIQRLQVAAALLIARADPVEGRRALEDVLDGPIDWVSEAALVGLTEIALDDPSAVEAIAQHIERTADRLPKGGHFGMAQALAAAHHRLPGRPPHLRAMLDHEARVEQSEPESSES
jgi:tetratricopeptide (TPR) repeat protein